MVIHPSWFNEHGRKPPLVFSFVFVEKCHIQCQPHILFTSRGGFKDEIPLFLTAV